MAHGCSRRSWLRQEHPAPTSDRFANIRKRSRHCGSRRVGQFCRADYLQATKKAVEALGLDPAGLGPPGESTAPLGNWIINLIPIGDRDAYLFVNCKTLLSFPILIGKHKPVLQDMPQFLNHGLLKLVEWLKLSTRNTELATMELDQIAFCVTEDKSLLGVIRSLAADYEHRTQLSNDLQGGSLGSIIPEINSTPRATLHYKTPAEKAVEVLGASEA
jgi:hypothetical protein